MPTLEKALQVYFGYPSFRPGQEEIVRHILAGRDGLAVLPTGGGKSICYQLPALLLPGLTLVVSPLISLMKDQVDQLQRQGIPAHYLNSQTQAEDYRTILDGLDSGELKLLYVSPERLANEGFKAFMTRRQVSFLAVDEAHCISQWGHDFRPAYQEISSLLDRLDSRPVVAGFTATATQQVQEDIIQQLKLQKAWLHIQSFDRPNIQLLIREPASKKQALLEWVHEDESIIVYAKTRKGVDQVHDFLLDKGFQAGKYHAGMTDGDRARQQEDFIYDRVHIMVATNAFGMGIDKTDIRRVIHYDLPLDLESYYQELGRAGRDGLPAEGVLLYHPQDIVRNRLLIRESQSPNVDEKLQAMIYYTQETRCLRNYILQYFGEKTGEGCGNCSACLKEFHIQDVSQSAQKILSCIIRMKQPFGMTMVTDVLKGRTHQRIRSWDFDQLSTYGIMADQSDGEIKSIISQLIAQKYISVNAHKGLTVPQKSLAVLKGEEAVQVKALKSKKRASLRVRPPKPAGQVPDQPKDPDLYEALKQLRAETAGREKVPAYIIFSNRSLIHMTYLLPQDKETFLQVDGVGDYKANRYWKDFGQLIKDYTASMKGQHDG